MNFNDSGYTLQEMKNLEDAEEQQETVEEEETEEEAEEQIVNGFLK